MTEQQLLTVEQIAAEFQLTSQTIRNWIKSGALQAVKIGHVYRLRREDVDEMMRRHEGETAPFGTHRDLWPPETLGMPYRVRSRLAGAAIARPTLPPPRTKSHGPPNPAVPFARPLHWPSSPVLP